MSFDEKFEAWARLPILNLNLEKHPALKSRVDGGFTYCDPTTEIARAAWHAGRTADTAALRGALVKARPIVSFTNNRRPWPAAAEALSAIDAALGGGNG